MLDSSYGPPKPLRAKNYIYDLVEDTNTKREPDLRLILTSYVDGWCQLIAFKNELTFLFNQKYFFTFRCWNEG